MSEPQNALLPGNAQLLRLEVLLVAENIFATEHEAALISLERLCQS